MLKYILGLLLVAGYAYCQWKENYRYPGPILPASLAQPENIELVNEPLITQTASDLKMVLEPKFDFTIAGLVLVVKPNNSSFCSNNQIVSLLPAHLNISFGGNLSSGAYKDLKKHGDIFQTSIKYSLQEHQQINIFSTDKATRNKILSLRPGDQVKLRGYGGIIKIYRTGDGPSGPVVGEFQSSPDKLVITQASDVTVLSKGSRLFLYLMWTSVVLALLLLIVWLKP